MTTSPRKVAEEMPAAVDEERRGRQAAETEAASERAERTAVEDEAAVSAPACDWAWAEIDGLQTGGSQFGLYADRGGQYRWRLRHRNGNVIADSGEGYASLANLPEARNSVKRNAPNAEPERLVD